MNIFTPPYGWLWAVALCWGQTMTAAQLEVMEIPGQTLKGNPLGDPTRRPVAVFVPEKTTRATALPLVIYLPGWGGSAQDAIASGREGWQAAVVDRLAAEHLPLRLVVVDGRSRYGGSQFLNSGATGAYADYVAEEIFTALQARYAGAAEHPQACLVAGHSSGAYGALLLAMSRQERFYGVVALSPDSDFETTHKPLVEQPAVRAVTPAELAAAMAPPAQAHLPQEGLATLIMGLCANYAPEPGHPGRFEWLYDAQGRWQPQVWQRWIDLDPLTLVRRRPEAFGKSQRVYLDGAEHDEFGANIGARKMYEILRHRASPVTFYEPPGEHGEHLPERLARGLKWVLEGQQGSR